MTKDKFGGSLIIQRLIQFFLEGLFATLLWNGVGQTILGLRHVTYWQMLGLTLLVSLIVPRGLAQAELLKKIAFDKEGNEK